MVTDLIFISGLLPWFSDGCVLTCLSFPVPSSVVTSSGIVKIVVRQSSKEGGGVPTLAVPPSPRVAPQASPSIHHHANTNIALRSPLAHCHPGPATAQYTLAPPRTPTSVTIRTSAPPRIPIPAPPRTPTPALLQNPTPAPSQPEPPRPVLKVVKGPAETSTEQKGEEMNANNVLGFCIYNPCIEQVNSPL